MQNEYKINEPCIVDVLVDKNQASITWSVGNGTDEIKIDLNENNQGSLKFEFGDTSDINSFYFDFNRKGAANNYGEKYFTITKYYHLMQNNVQIYERRYSNIFNIFSEIGGIAQFIFYLGGISQEFFDIPSYFFVKNKSFSGLFYGLLRIFEYFCGCVCRKQI